MYKLVIISEIANYNYRGSYPDHSLYEFPLREKQKHIMPVIFIFEKP